MAKTPALQVVADSGTEHTIHTFDAGSSNFGEDAAHSMGGDPTRIFKTLVIELSTGKLAVCVIPVPEKLNLKRAAKAFGVPKAAMAETAKAQRSTGYVPGGISPLGQKKRLRSFIDNSAQALPVIHVSAGRRGLEVSLAPQDLAGLISAGWAPIGKPA